MQYASLPMDWVSSASLISGRSPVSTLFIPCVVEPEFLALMIKRLPSLHQLIAFFPFYDNPTKYVFRSQIFEKDIPPPFC